jgi:threonine/homoserine/homoserine lactone efflux protein
VPGYVWSFAAMAVPFVATPGASTAIVLRNSIVGGVRSGVATAFGVNVGSAAYGLLTAFGVSAALQRWPDVWTGLRIAGVAYLAWLGVRALWRARRPTPGAGAVLPGQAALDAADRVRLPAYGRDAREGFLTNALNPSIAMFYLLLMPQFIPNDAPFAPSALVLTTVHVGLAFSWHVTWAAAGGTLATTLSRPRPRRIVDALTGVMLLAFAFALLP